MDTPDLDLVATKDLLATLLTRFDDAVFVGAVSGDPTISVTRDARGDYYVALGLLQDAAHDLMSCKATTTIIRDPED